MNTITCTALLSLNLDLFAQDKRLMFLFCLILSLFGLLVFSSFIKVNSKTVVDVSNISEETERVNLLTTDSDDASAWQYIYLSFRGMKINFESYIPCLWFFYCDFVFRGFIIWINHSILFVQECMISHFRHDIFFQNICAIVIFRIWRIVCSTICKHAFHVGNK